MRNNGGGLDDFPCVASYGNDSDVRPLGLEGD